MPVDIDTDVARSVAADLRLDADDAHAHKIRATELIDAAEFTVHGTAAETDFGGANTDVVALADLLKLYADRMDAADCGNLDALAALDASLTYAWGAFIGRFIRPADADHDGHVLAALLEHMTPAATANWFNSMDHEDRLRLKAINDDVLDGSAAAALFATWFQGLPADDLRQLFLIRALHKAGININAWDPARGLDANAETVEAVYAYYGELYRDHPDEMWWAGMAALIGPSFYGGFRDLETFADLLDTFRRLEELDVPLGLPHHLASELAEMSAAELEQEFRWFQQRMLGMQQEIFVDMAPPHEAYLEGGPDLVARMLADDPYGYGDATTQAWYDIASGDPDRIAAGNRALLFREQYYVIDDDYQAMYDRPVTGPVTTYMMTAVGSPSVPGAQSYPEVFPLEISDTVSVGTPERIGLPFGGPTIGVPHVGVETTVTITTPLPDGNIANFEDRWALIEQDTLPVYVELAANHPDVIIDEINIPVGERAQEYEIDAWFDDVALRMLTDWETAIDVDVQVGIG